MRASLVNIATSVVTVFFPLHLKFQDFISYLGSTDKLQSVVKKNRWNHSLFWKVDWLTLWAWRTKTDRVSPMTVHHKRINYWWYFRRRCKTVGFALELKTCCGNGKSKKWPLRNVGTKWTVWLMKWKCFKELLRRMLRLNKWVIG